MHGRTSERKTHCCEPEHRRRTYILVKRMAYRNGLFYQVKVLGDSLSRNVFRIYLAQLVQHVCCIYYYIVLRETWGHCRLCANAY